MMGQPTTSVREQTARRLDASQRELLALARGLPAPEAHLLDALVLLTAATADLLRALDRRP